MAVQRDLSFSEAEYEGRMQQIRQRMEDHDLDILVVNDCPNLCYLSGYQSWNTGPEYFAFVIPRSGDPSLVVWYNERANGFLTSWVSSYLTYVAGGDPVAVTIESLRDYGVTNGRIGMELGSPFLNAKNYLRFKDEFPGATFVDCTGWVNDIRTIKSPAEIEYLRQSAAITDIGTKASLDVVRQGVSDQEIATAGYNALIGGGSSYMAIPPVVSAGMLSGIPHSTHRGVTVDTGDTVLLEYGACIHRYSAPIMRTAVVGKPNDTEKRMTDAVLAALNAVIDAMAPGVSFDEVATIGEKAIASAGPDMIFHHVFAYSVGLGYAPNWADAPVRIVQGDKTILEPGMVFHLPVALRLEALHGVGISETVAITETGNEVLTKLDRKLFER